MTELI